MIYKALVVSVLKRYIFQLYIYFCNIVKLTFKDALKVFMTVFEIDRGSIDVLH